MKSIQEQAEAQALAFVKSYGSAYETNREKQGGIEAYEKGYVAGASYMQTEVERLREENERFRKMLGAVAESFQQMEQVHLSRGDEETATTCSQLASVINQNT